MHDTQGFCVFLDELLLWIYYDQLPDIKADSTDLREGEHGAHGPGHGQHDFAPPLGLADAQRVEDGRLAVQADHHRHEGTGVHGHQLQEHQHPAGQAGMELHEAYPPLSLECLLQNDSTNVF